MQNHRSNILTFLIIAFTCIIVTIWISLGSGIASAQQQQRYTGNENHVITLDQGIKYVQNFTANPTTPNTKGGYFGGNIFDKILSQSGCVGIRYYYAKTDNGSSTIVLVGVDTSGNDLTHGILAEEPIPCPPFCAPTSPFNK